MVSLIFGLVALIGAGYSIFSFALRRAILSLWVTGLAVGAVYLTLGSELLAVAQWIVSTLVTVSLIFFSSLFGEFDSVESRPKSKDLLKISFAILAGFGLLIVIYGSGLLNEATSVLGPIEGTDVFAMGRALLTEHLLALEVFSLTLLTVVVGAGVIARPNLTKNKGAEEAGV